MVGYLNAPNPFDEEGWMCTGDEVEVKEILPILEKIEAINVGGKNVSYWTETVLLSLKYPKCSCLCKSHPIMGQVVRTQVSVIEPEDPLQLSERLRNFVTNDTKYKVPLEVFSGE